jgi:ketosteroid isomerase-like protein
VRGIGPERLVSAYAAAVDARDWVALGRLFTADAVLLTPDPPRSLDPVIESRGRESILATIQQVSAFEWTEHLIGATTWTVDGTTASGTTTGEAHHVVVGAQHAWVWLVEYADDCSLSDVGWQFTRRVLTVRAIERRSPA